jgi:hypothetical protein
MNRLPPARPGRALGRRAPRERAEGAPLLRQRRRGLHRLPVRQGRLTDRTLAGRSLHLWVGAQRIRRGPAAHGVARAVLLRCHAAHRRAGAPAERQSVPREGQGRRDHRGDGARGPRRTARAPADIGVGRARLIAGQTHPGRGSSPRRAPSSPRWTSSSWAPTSSAQRPTYPIRACAVWTRCTWRARWPSLRTSRRSSPTTPAFSPPQRQRDSRSPSPESDRQRGRREIYGAAIGELLR